MLARPLGKSSLPLVLARPLGTCSLRVSATLKRRVAIRGWSLPRKRKKDAVYTIRALVPRPGPIPNESAVRAICGQPQKRIAARRREETEPEGSPAKSPTDALSPSSKLGGSDGSTSGPLSSQGEPVDVEAMKNRLHAIFTEEGKINIIVSMYKKGARYKDIASETGLSIPSVRYRLVELSYKGLVHFQPRYRSHTKRRR